MPDVRRVHRFRDHTVVGVNWRPTRFVDEVPSSRVCSLCRMIPKRTLLLPCSHALCQQCHATASRIAGGRCPLDQEPFEESECLAYDLFARNAKILKVHCWNDTRGCQFEGIVEDMLRHYETGCAFHAVECPRCGERVLHREMSSHYVRGCSTSVSPRAEDTSSEPAALTLEEVNAALEELKALLRDSNHDHLLPTVQSQMNELREEVRNQESRLVDISRGISAAEETIRAEIAQIAAAIPARIPELPRSHLNPADEASASLSLSLDSEKTLILRKLEHFVSLSLGGLEYLRQISERRVNVCCAPKNISVLHLTSSLTSTRTWTEAYGSVSYVVTIENCREIIECRETSKKFAQVAVLHMRDTCFTVEVWKRLFREAYHLTVEIKFYGMLVDSRCLPPIWHLVISDAEQWWKRRTFSSSHKPCECRHNGDMWAHFHVTFEINFEFLERNGFLRDRQLQFEIELSHVENPQAGH